MKKHILYAVTTLNGGTLPGAAQGEAKARGLKWLANFGVDPLADPTEVRDRMERHAGMTQPQYDGFTSDELFFGNVTIDNYTRALKDAPQPPEPLDLHLDRGQAEHLLPAHRLHVRRAERLPGARPLAV